MTFKIIMKKIYVKLGKTCIKNFPGIKTLNDYFFRLLWSGKSVIDVQGSKMCVNFNDDSRNMRKTFQDYTLNQIHEERTTELFKNMIKEGDIVVDLGANIGYFTLLAAKMVNKKGRVYSFEPEPKNYSYLVKNIKLNGYDNAIATQKAVANESGKTKLYICHYDSGHHTINQYDGIKDYKPNLVRDDKDFIEIDKITLDDFFKNKNKRVDVIKMDVEGAEFLALLGMDKIIKANKNLKMFIEFFPLLIRKMGNSPEEFVRKLLEDYNFSISVIGEDYQAAEKNIKIDNVEKLMSLIRDEKDHLNLFLER